MEHGPKSIHASRAVPKQRIKSNVAFAMMAKQNSKKMLKNYVLNMNARMVSGKKLKNAPHRVKKTMAFLPNVVNVLIMKICILRTHSYMLMTLSILVIVVS